MFLNRLLGRIIVYDPDTGDVALRLEEEILEMDLEDPLVVNKIFQFKTKEQREKDEKKARRRLAKKSSIREGVSDSDEDASSVGSMLSPKSALGSPVGSFDGGMSPMGSFDATGSSFSLSGRGEEEEVDLDQGFENFEVPKGLFH